MRLKAANTIQDLQAAPRNYTSTVFAEATFIGTYFHFLD